MAGIGAAFGGLAQGLAEGLQTGVQLGQRQEQIDLQKSEQKLKIASAFASLKKMPLDMRKIVAPGLLKQFESAYGMEVPQVMKDMAVKGDDEVWGKVVDQAASFMMTGKGDIEQLKAGLKQLGDPAEAVAFLDKIGAAQHRKEVLAETKRHARAVEGISAATLAETRAERAERRAERQATAEVSLSKSVIDDFKDTLNKEDRGKYVSALQSDQGYKMALRLGRSDIAYQRAGDLITKNPQWINQTDVQKKIAAIKAANPSISDTDAQKIALGLQTMEVVPQTGEIRLLDKTTGTARAIPIAPSGPQPPETAPTLTKPLYESAQEGRIAGIESGITDIWSRTAGQILGRLPGQSETIKARQDAEIIGRDLVRALQNNPRFSEGERAAIAKEVAIEPSIWDSRAALTSRMESISARMRERLRDAQRASNNPNLPQELRSQQMQSAEAIRNFLRKLGAPPPNLPEGAKRVGRTREGFFVYETKQGRRIVDEY